MCFVYNIFIYSIIPEYGYVDVFWCCLYRDESWQMYKKQHKGRKEAAYLHGCQGFWAGLGLLIIPWHVVLFMLLSVFNTAAVWSWMAVVLLCLLSHLDYCTSTSKLCTGLKRTLQKSQKKSGCLPNENLNMFICIPVECVNICTRIKNSATVNCK